MSVGLFLNPVTGPSGATWRSGAGTPSNGLGLDGDFYFDTTNTKIYVKASGVYTLIATLGTGTITALTGDVSASGSGSVAATVNSVGTSSAANIHTAELLANAATAANTASAVIRRDASGNAAVSSPLAASDIATKAYVDAGLAALNPATSVYAATTANLTGTYLNGAAGIGATFVITATGAFTLDGTTPPVNSRILIKNQSSGFQNGIYDLTLAGSIGVSPILTRSGDYNTATEINNAGLIPVINGTVNALSSWQQVAVITTVGTDSLVFTEFTANPSLYLLKANNLSDVASANTAFNNISPMTTLGDITYENSTPAATRLAGNTTTTNKFLTQVGNGSISAAPVWSAIGTADLPVVPETKGGTNQSTYTTGDTLYASASNTLSKLAAGTNLQIMRQAAGIPSWQNFYKISVEGTHISDFESLPATSIPHGIFLAPVSGTGAAVASFAPTAGSSQFGVADLQTGTTTTGIARIVSGSSTLLFGTGSFIQEWVTHVPVASDGTDTYSIQWGCFDTNTITPTNAAGLLYSTATSPNFITQTSDNSTRTTTTSSTAVPIATWFRLTMIANAAGTSISWYLNDVLIGTNTTNIPTASGRSTKVAQCQILKSAGTTSRSVYVDAYAHMFRPTTPR